MSGSVGVGHLGIPWAAVQVAAILAGSLPQVDGYTEKLVAGNLVNAVFLTLALSG